MTLTFAWISPLSMVIIPENFMMIRWQEQCEKVVTDRRTGAVSTCLGAAKRVLDYYIYPPCPPSRSTSNPGDVSSLHADISETTHTHTHWSHASQSQWGMSSIVSPWLPSLGLRYCKPSIFTGSHALRAAHLKIRQGSIDELYGQSSD